MYKEYEVVKAVRQLNEKVRTGAVGTILIVHREPDIACVVEFTDGHGDAVDIPTVSDKGIEMYIPGGRKRQW